jgi:SAM-dependent methyltransferase
MRPFYHRKEWEYVYIMQVLHEAGMLRAGRSGLGFGVGHEPLVALIAAHGCSVLATDLDKDAAIEGGWLKADATVNQYAGSLDELNAQGICDPDAFRDRVQYRVLDMNRLPADLGKFDFLWSSCALEHLGSLDNGLNFIRKSLSYLRPGGVAVHTTEYNLSSGRRTVDRGETVLYRRGNITNLMRSLRREGYAMRINFDPGDGPIDHHIDIPPYTRDPHLKLRIGQYVSTALGLVIHKARAS